MLASFCRYPPFETLESGHFYDNWYLENYDAVQNDEEVYKCVFYVLVPFCLRPPELL